MYLHLLRLSSTPRFHLCLCLCSAFEAAIVPYLGRVYAMQCCDASKPGTWLDAEPWPDSISDAPCVPRLRLHLPRFPPCVTCGGPALAATRQQQGATPTATWCQRQRPAPRTHMLLRRQPRAGGISSLLLLHEVAVLLLLQAGAGRRRQGAKKGGGSEREGKETLAGHVMYCARGFQGCQT
eukprot:COSAG01_NODE_5880_length_3972_cov_7.084172_3_plen_181_part_00